LNGTPDAHKAADPRVATAISSTQGAQSRTLGASRVLVSRLFACTSADGFVKLSRISPSLTSRLD
jgi:hypothetical protein